ncbi:hypothetical protein D1BOALGB6SA_8789 [Olavius sp. associated proteobacterium Delta 1]|nr:hypothetical protein D1BOALGB6SA_8789 [Olavius sp. associated proteobacterium Delta 1]
MGVMNNPIESQEIDSLDERVEQEMMEQQELRDETQFEIHDEAKGEFEEAVVEEVGDPIAEKVEVVADERALAAEIGEIVIEDRFEPVEHDRLDERLLDEMVEVQIEDAKLESEYMKAELPGQKEYESYVQREVAPEKKPFIPRGAHRIKRFYKPFKERKGRFRNYGKPVQDYKIKRNYR